MVLTLLGATGFQTRRLFNDGVDPHRASWATPLLTADTASSAGRGSYGIWASYSVGGNRYATEWAGTASDASGQSMARAASKCT
jgi:hypothetical protein